MRCLTVLLLSLIAHPGSAEVYRWVDDQGVVHYTDKPPSPGAKPAELPEIQSFTPAQPLPVAPKPDAPPAAVEYRLRIASPTQDQVLRSPAPQETVSATVAPALADGHGLRFIFDGKVVNDTPTRSRSLSLPTVYRGTHTLAVAVVDAKGKELQRSSTVTFHKLPPTVKRNRP